jgi:Cdc6-like AAA superfamily ATPase
MTRKFLMADETVFQDFQVFETHFVPEQFVHRDAQMADLAFQMMPGMKGNRPLNTIIRGLPGTGKTTSVRTLFNEIEETTRKLVPVYVNCQTNQTKFAVLSEIYKKTFRTVRSKQRHITEKDTRYNRNTHPEKRVCGCGMPRRCELPGIREQIQ